MRFSLALLLLLSVVASLQATKLSSKRQKHKLIEKYATIKLLESCFGREMVARRFQKRDQYLTDCYKQVKEEYKSKAETEPVTEAEAPVSSTVLFPARKVKYLKKKSDMTLKIATCFLDKLNLTIAANGQVDGTYMKDTIISDTQNPELQQLVLEGVEKCEKKSGCGQYSQIPAKYEDQMKYIKFFRCAKEAQVTACVKYDLNQNKDMFDLSPLSDITDLDDTAKMMMVLAKFATSDYTGLFGY